MERGEWNSRVGFILATTGSAVGLGNIWRFPYVVGTSGGGAFVLVFTLIMFLIGIPLMMGELVLGRASHRNPVGAFKALAPESSWWLAGLLQVGAGILILSYYSVIAGWSLAYFFRTARGGFLGLDNQMMAEEFNSLVGAGLQPLLWHAFFMVVVVVIVIGGISGGIERWSRILVPLFFLLILFMLYQVLQLPGAREGLVWFLRPDISQLNMRILLGAIGQVFFSLSLGMGAVLTYGSYLSSEENIPENALYISLADLVLALLAGMIIIPAVFAFNLEPDAGPGLIFITLPAIFNQMPGGVLFGSIFFLFLSIAALTSAISLLEVVVSYLIDEWKLMRANAALLAGLAIFLLGIPSSLSQGRINIFILGYSFLDFADLVASDIALPLGGLLLTIFIGWKWGRKEANKELHEFVLAEAWGYLIKYLIPLAMIYVFFSNLI